MKCYQFSPVLQEYCLPDEVVQHVCKCCRAIVTARQAFYELIEVVVKSQHAPPVPGDTSPAVSTKEHWSTPPPTLKHTYMFMLSVNACMLSMIYTHSHILEHTYRHSHFLPLTLWDPLYIISFLHMYHMWCE